MKVALVTGSSKGIGFGIVQKLLDLGYFVYGVSRGDSTLKHQNYKHFSINVTDEESIISLFSIIRKDKKRLDILINNAGTASMNHILLTPMSTYNKIFSTNFLGTFLFSREAAKLMKRNLNGRIINFSTVAVPLNLEGEAIYSASKASIEQFTRTMAKEVASFGITVNCVGPAPIETDLIKNVPKEKIDLLINSQAIKRLGKIEDVINVIFFLLKEESSFVTGQTIYLGGVF